MIKINLEINLFNVFNLQLKIGNNKNVSVTSSGVDTPSSITDECDAYTPPLDENYTPNNSFVENCSNYDMLSHLTTSSNISEIATQYENELKNISNDNDKIVVPPFLKNGADKKETEENLSAPFSLGENVESVENISYEGLYDIGDTSSDYMSEEFKDYPCVELVDDGYELRLENALKLANQRYATYRETHDLD